MTVATDRQAKLNFIQQCKADPVFMVEHLLYSEAGKLYQLEDHQKEFLRCDSSYRMLFWARRLAKSTTVRFDLIHKAMFTPSLRILGVLPSWSQANDFGGEIQDLINRSDFVGEMFDKTNATTMRLKNNSRINMATAGKEGVSQLGRGARYMVFDEAQQIPDRTFGYLLPILRGTPGKKWQVFSGTPLGKMGVFWEVYKDAELLIRKGKRIKVEETEFNIGTERFIVFERQTAYLNKDGDIIESGTGRIEIPELASDRRRMGEIHFLREYCLNWMDAIGEVFPKELIDMCLGKSEGDKEVGWKGSSEEECVAGVDFGKQRNNSVLTVGERKKDGKLDIIFIHSFPLGTKYDKVIDYVVDTLPNLFPNLRKIVVDQTGVGEGVIDSLIRESRRKKNKFKIVGFNFAGGEKKKELVEAGVFDMEKQKVRMLFHNDLYLEMLAFKRELSEKTNRILYTKPEGGSDDFVDSFLLCLMANRNTFGTSGNLSVISVGGQSSMSRLPSHVIQSFSREDMGLMNPNNSKQQVQRRILAQRPVDVLRQRGIYK